MKTKVYIAGPYTKGDPVVNTRNAMNVWKQLWDLGYVPVCPHWSMFQHCLHPMPWEQWIAYDAELLKDCRVVLRLPGESAGADIETKFAAECGIPVVSTIEYLLDAFPPMNGDPP